MSPCLDQTESGAGHLAALVTPPVLSYMCLPSGLGRDSESEGEVAEAPQPRTVEAMCEANWPAQTRPTEALMRATWRGPAAIRGLVRNLLGRRPMRRQGAWG
jgi:hypothetical protein